MLSSLAFASADQNSNENTLSLETLKEKCMELKQNEQIKPFNIRVVCSGSYTSWEEQTGTATLANQSVMRTQTSTKCGRFQTDEKITSNAIEAQTISCPIMVKHEMSAPKTLSIPVSLGSCEELNTHNLRDLCSQRVQEFCEDNHYIANVKNKTMTRLNKKKLKQKQKECVGSKEVDRFDACSKY